MQDLTKEQMRTTVGGRSWLGDFGAWVGSLYGKIAWFDDTYGPHNDHVWQQNFTNYQDYVESGSNKA